jgi:hypothetical protein
VVDVEIVAVPGSVTGLTLLSEHGKTKMLWF